jgi:NADH-quinone oxidoreductase subunit F
VKVVELPPVATAFQAIKEHAVSRWQELWHNHQPVILVGTATCGRAAGALEVLKTLRDEVNKHKLDCPVI